MEGVIGGWSFMSKRSTFNRSFTSSYKIQCWVVVYILEFATIILLIRVFPKLFQYGRESHYDRVAEYCILEKQDLTIKQTSNTHTKCCALDLQSSRMIIGSLSAFFVVALVLAFQ